MILSAAFSIFCGTTETPAFSPDTVREKDTVLVIRENFGEDLLEALNLGQFQTQNMEKARIQGYGASGGFTPGLMFSSMSPVKKLLGALEKELHGKNIAGNMVFFLGTGGIGYGGLGRGLRIGGAGASYYSIDGINYTGNDGIDSSAYIRTSLRYGGVIAEKAWVRDRMNFFAGGLIGGGSMNVDVFRGKKEGSFFGEASPALMSGDPLNADTFTLAGDIRAGFTYTMLSWMHMGMESGLVYFYSPTGFNNYIGPFGLTAPVVKLRVIFGLLG